MNHKIEDAILKYNMVNYGDNVIVAVSGGADSMSLLHFLLNNKQKYNINVSACHVNHNLRGAESMRDEQFVRDFCKKHDIPLFVKSVDINQLSKQLGLSLEECGRDIRYSYFEELSKNQSKIATAHTLSDSAETILYHMARGTSLKGLMGIPAVRGNIIRPLIFCSREDIECYCSDNNIEYVTDSTNLETEYTRNKIRHLVVPVLKQINESFETSVLRMSESLRVDEDFLDLTTNDELAKRTSEKGFFIDDFLKVHQSIRYRCIAKLLNLNHAEINLRNIELIDEIVLNKKGKIQLTTDLFAIVKQDVLVFEKSKIEKQIDYYEIELTEGKHHLFENTYANVVILDTNSSEFIKIIKNLKKINQNVLKKFINYDNIKTNAVIRQKKDGDRIKLPNRNGSKSLKKLFNESKIPPSLRSLIPVIEYNNEIIWVCGFGSSESYCIDEHTKKILCIDILEN